MPSEDELSELLQRGFFIDNLYELCRACIRRARSATEPVAYYVLAKLFNDIATDWEGRPLPNDEADHLEHVLADKLRALLALLRSNADAPTIAVALNELLLRFLAEPERT